MNFYNAPLKDTIMNGIIKPFLTYSGCTLYVTVSIAASPHDREYSITFLKTTVDLKRLLTGVYANPILRSAMENLLSALDFEVKFPFQPVSIKSLEKIKSSTFFAGHIQYSKFFAY